MRISKGNRIATWLAVLLGQACTPGCAVDRTTRVVSYNQMPAVDWLLTAPKTKESQ